VVQLSNGNQTPSILTYPYESLIKLNVSVYIVGEIPVSPEGVYASAYTLNFTVEHSGILKP